MTDPIDTKAREMLAAAYRHFGHEPVAVDVERGSTVGWDAVAIYAICAALRAAPELDDPSVAEGWVIRKRATCYQLCRGNHIIANLAGPDAEHYATVISQMIERFETAARPGEGA